MNIYQPMSYLSQIEDAVQDSEEKSLRLSSSCSTLSTEELLPSQESVQSLSAETLCSSQNIPFIQQGIQSNEVQLSPKLPLLADNVPLQSRVLKVPLLSTTRLPVEEECNIQQLDSINTTSALSPTVETTSKEKTTHTAYYKEGKAWIRFQDKPPGAEVKIFGFQEDVQKSGKKNDISISARYKAMERYTISPQTIGGLPVRARGDEMATNNHSFFPRFLGGKCPDRGSVLRRDSQLQSNGFGRVGTSIYKDATIQETQVPRVLHSLPVQQHTDVGGRKPSDCGGLERLRILKEREMSCSPPRPEREGGSGGMVDAEKGEDVCGRFSMHQQMSHHASSQEQMGEPGERNCKRPRRSLPYRNSSWWSSSMDTESSDNSDVPSPRNDGLSD